MTTVEAAKSVAPLVDSDTGDDPTTPADPPSALTLLAAARRESFSASPTPHEVANASAPTLRAAALAEPADPDETGPTPVVAIPQTAPLQGLQYLPVRRPTGGHPDRHALHQIPLVGDVLHPFIGYPVQLGLPAGTPAPRDVKVISFDGTQIYVHFLPATGLAAGQTGADHPRRSRPCPSRFDELPVREGRVPAERRHRHRCAALGRLQRRHVGSARRMEFGRPVGDRLARLRGTRRLRDHQLAGDAARGPARRGGTRPADRHGRRLLRRRHPTGRRRHRRPDRRDRADHRVAQPDHLAVQEPGVQEQLGHAAHGRPCSARSPDRTHGSIRPRSSATSRAWCRRPTRTCWRTAAPATWSTRSPRRRC